MRFDHHLHTAKHSPDSSIDPWELIEHAREIGLDGVVITEHDYQWEADELAELAVRAAPLRVFSGVEVSTLEGHFLVYGLPSLEDVFPGIELAELLPLVHRHQAAIVGAHPFRWDQPFNAIVAQHGPVFDALELVSNNVTTETRLRTEALLRASDGSHRLERRARDRHPGLLLHRVRWAHRHPCRFRRRPSRPGLPAPPSRGSTPHQRAGELKPERAWSDESTRRPDSWCPKFCRGRGPNVPFTGSWRPSCSVPSRTRGGERRARREAGLKEPRPAA